MPVRPARIAEPLNIDDDDGPVDSEPLIHLLPPLKQDRADSYQRKVYNANSLTSASASIPQ